MLIFSKRSLWVLLVLNWLFVIAFALFLLALLVPASLAMLASVLERGAAPQEVPLLLATLRWVMAIGIAAGLAVHVMFRQLLAIVATAIEGDPFTRANAGRLRTIGWALLALQLLDLAFGYLSYLVESGTGERLAWSPSLTGWIAMLMVFVLARVFEHGGRMRDELAMTV